MLSFSTSCKFRCLVQLNVFPSLSVAGLSDKGVKGIVKTEKRQNLDAPKLKELQMTILNLTLFQTGPGFYVSAE